jgi:CRP-like cAMP-binding protein
VLRQGTNDDDLFLVLSGKVQVRIDLPAGGAVTVDEVGPGGVVGEMALLTGNARSATVTALEQVDFAQLARGDFERLALKHPDALNEFLQRLVPRLRRTQMIQALIALFGELDAAALADLEKELAWVRLRGGDTLFREGDHGSDVYIIVNGRLRASVVDGEGHVRILEEVVYKPGLTFAELARALNAPKSSVHGFIRGLLFGVAIACCIAGYTLVDKEGVRHASPIPYLELVLAGPAFVYLGAMLVARGREAVRAEIRPVNGDPYYLVRPTWTGAVATTVQRLLWPRTGMYSRTGQPLDPAVNPSDLKDATAELARQLKKGDRTSDNDVAVQGITAVRAGSVSVSFKGDGIDITKVIPDIIFMMIPPSWLTDELYESANMAQFDVVSE